MAYSVGAMGTYGGIIGLNDSVRLLNGPAQQTATPKINSYRPNQVTLGLSKIIFVSMQFD